MNVDIVDDVSDDVEEVQEGLRESITADVVAVANPISVTSSLSAQRDEFATGGVSQECDNSIVNFVAEKFKLSTNYNDAEKAYNDLLSSIPDDQKFTHLKRHVDKDNSVITTWLKPGSDANDVNNHIVHKKDINGKESWILGKNVDDVILPPQKTEDEPGFSVCAVIGGSNKVIAGNKNAQMNIVTSKRVDSMRHEFDKRVSPSPTVSRSRAATVSEQRQEVGGCRR